MSDDNEERNGPGLAAGVGGTVGLGASAYAADRYLADKGIVQALEGKKDAPAKIADEVKKVLGDNKNSALKDQNKSLNAVKDVLEHNGKPRVSSITFKGKAGEYVMHSTLPNGKSHVLGGIKNLPSGVTVDKAITDQKVITEMYKDGLKSKPLVESGKSLVTGVRKAGEFELGTGLRNGFKGLNGVGKGKIIGGVVAVTAAGAFVTHQLFGGKHSSRVESERAAQQDLGRA